jgi:hypothetical protein
MKTITITVKVEKSEDLKAICNALATKHTIYFNNDTMKADFKYDQSKQEITIKQSRVNYPNPIRL